MHEKHRSPYQSPLRSPRRSSKSPNEKRLRMARRSIWTWAKHRVGLERPHFWPLARGQRTTGVAPARNEISFVVLPACRARFCAYRLKEEGEQSEDGKNYTLQPLLLHFLHPDHGPRN